MKIRGMNVWPQVIETLLLAHPGVAEFRGEAARREDGSDELILRLRPNGGQDALDDMVDGLTDAVRRETLVRPRILIDREIPDSAGDYKVRRWQDSRKEHTK